MPKLDQTYIYYDNRKMKTHFAQTSFIELEIAYKKLTSGSSMRLYLYLLHKISGRTPYDRNNEPRLGYYLGIEQIENAIGISRASIYRGFSELVKHGLLEKHTYKTNDETKNIICTLSIPIKNETENDKTQTNEDTQRSQKRDQQISQFDGVKGNSSKNDDLKIEPINLQQTKTIINPLIPKGKNIHNENENSKKAFKNDLRKKEIMRIVYSLENHGYSFIDEVIQFSNIYTWIRSSTNLSRRKRDIYKAIQIHNERMQARTEMDLTSNEPANAKVENLGGASPEKIKKQDDDLHRLISGDYNKYLHDNLLKQDSYIWTLPQVLQDKYIPILKQKISEGHRAEEEKIIEMRKKQKEFDQIHQTTKKIIPDVDTNSKKYKDLQFQLINQFAMNKDKK